MFLWFLLHFKHLNIKCVSSIFMYSKQDLQSVHLLLSIPSTKLDNELDKTLKLPINFILYAIVVPF